MSGAVIYCGIDPGRDKFGLALATAEALCLSAIFEIGRMDFALGCIAGCDWPALGAHSIEGEGVTEGAALSCTYVGDGTNSRLFTGKLDEKSVKYVIVDESMTTLLARELYWGLHPPRGLRKLLPASLRVPPRPLDDLAAWAIIKRAVSP